MDRPNYDEFRQRIFDAVNGKSDRDAVITIVNWIDHLLERKLRETGSRRSAQARRLEQRVEAVHREGWIDAELRHDLHRLRQVRNTFAHSVDVSSLSDCELQGILAELRVPARQFHDWDSLGAVGTPDGEVVIYSGARPAGATEDLRIGGLRFKIGLSVIFSVLLASLELEFVLDGDGVVPTVPAHLRAPSAERRASSVERDAT